ncbi:MAG TPA: LysM peptidoglycan-binding domain-containing protein [Roseiflexaceae bacterium]|jgi:LysM repeat protein|nr:LysM peptidoglycan-binding domain-containing protein [Roseiflexaceae bacterium]
MMSPTIVLLLLLLALVLPVVGAAALRLLIPRLSARQFYIGAAAVFVIAVASVGLLARSNIDDVQVGNLTLVLPVSGMDNGDLALANPSLGSDTAPVSNTNALSMTAPVTRSTEISTTTMPVAAPTAVVQATEAAPTEAPTATPTATAAPTEAPTPTEEPTAVPPTEPPPTEPPPPPTEAPKQQTYTVKKGDTLRSIAEKFDVSVEALLNANNLTARQADALHIGQKLVIP